MTNTGNDPGLEWRDTVAAPSRDGDASSTAEADGLPVVSRSLYRVISEVGKGGIGQVFAAHDERLHRRVAVKELQQEAGGSEVRFVREAMLTARLQHPNIVPIYEAGRWPSGEAFYAMRFVSGRTLEDVLAEKKTLNERLSLLPHVLAIAEAIAYAHNERIIHRDLKPANVIIGSFGETVVIDWGIAKSLDSDEEQNNNPASNSTDENGLTIMGTVMGTPGYMSPEQAGGLPVDERTDVFALGAILYQLLAGLPPYHDLPSFRKITAVITKPPTPLAEMVPNVAPDLLAIAQKSMAREKERRYPSAREFADDLRRFQAGQIVGAHEYSFGELLRRFVQKHRLVLSVIAGASVILMVTGAWFIRENTLERNRADERRREAELAEQHAKKAEMDSIGHANDLTLLHAARDLDIDPNRTLAWLDTLSPTFDQYAEMRTLAADARSRGLARILRGHTKLIGSLAFFPNGRLLASTSDDKSLRLWDLESQEITVFEGHRDEVWKLIIAPDFRRIATNSLDRDVRIWDISSKKTLHTLSRNQLTEHIAFTKSGDIIGLGNHGPFPWIWSGDDQPVREIPEYDALSVGTLAADGSRIAGIAGDGTVWTAKPEDNKKEIIVRWKLSKGLRLRILANSRFVVAWPGGGKLTVWDAESHQTTELETSQPPIVAVDFVGNGQEFVIAYKDGTIQWWDLAKHAVLKTFEETSTGIQRVFGSADGRYVAFSNSDHSVRIRSKDELETRTFHGFTEPPMELRFSPDGRTLAVGCVNGDIRLLSLERADQRVLFANVPKLRQEVAVSSKGDRAWSFDANGTFRSWDLHKGELSWSKSVGAEPFFKLVAAPSGNAFVIAPFATNQVPSAKGQDLGEASRSLRVVSDTGEAIASIPITERIVNIAFVAGEKQLVASDANGDIVLYDLARARREKVLFHHEKNSQGLDISPDGNKIVSAGDDGIVCLMDLVTGQTRVIHKHEGVAIVVGFAPQGNRLASGGTDHRIFIHDLTTNEQIMISTSDAIEKLAFSPDGSTLASVAFNGSVIELFNARNGAPLRTLRGHTQFVRKIQFTRDGKRLVSSSIDGSLRIWNVATGTSRALIGHDEAIYSFDMTSDGQTIISSGADGTVRMFRDDLPEEPGALRAWIHEQATNEIRARQDTVAKP